MTRAPVLLLDPDMEPLEQLGAHGVPIVAVTFKRRDPVTASRWVAGIEQAPRPWSEGMDEWFADLLRRYPGTVLLPDSDDFAWYLSEWRERHGEGGARFAIPPRRALHTALAKGRLYEACLETGLDAPKTWMAPSVEAAMEGMAGARFPVAVKPQSRVGNLHWGRGQVVRNEAQLREAVAWALEHVTFRQAARQSMPGVEVPMVQEVAPGRDRPIYHLCGYLSARGEHALLAHRKLLQVPRRFGSGICFETAEVDIELAQRFLALLRHIGFHGMFEAEFVSLRGMHQLIDLNVRPYNGMRLEAERGLELAWYLYLEAVGEHERLRDELARATQNHATEGLTYCRKLEFAAMVGGQFVGGGFGFRDLRRWTAWYWNNRGHMVDPWVVPGDRAAGRAHLGSQLGMWKSSPRVFLGAYFRRESAR